MKEIITPQTSIIGISLCSPNDLSGIFVSQAINNIKIDVERAKRLSAFYIKYGLIFNLRADIAWSQMCHETGYLIFTGIAKPDWNNFCGLGITGPGAVQKFKTEELGVIAHYAHLAWYYFIDHVNEYCSIKYDPRHFMNDFSNHLKYNGDTTINHLIGNWAVPGITYAYNIYNIANSIYSNINIPNNNIEYDIIIQEGHVPRVTGFTGTNGEQDFVKAIGSIINNGLISSKIKYRIMGADNWYIPEPNICKVFFSLHCDGNLNIKANGFSCGYDINTNQLFKNIMANSYKSLTGFIRRKDNNTLKMKYYYAWNNKHIKAKYTLLLEHGFLTNLIQRKWLFDNINNIGLHHVKIIKEFFNNIK